MRIIWIKKKQFDHAPDGSTWVEMIQHLQDMGHDVTFYTANLAETPDFGLGEAIQYIPTSRIPVLHTFSFLLRLYPLIWLAVWRGADVVILDQYTIFEAFPLDILAKLGLIKTRFVVDVRSIIHDRNAPPLLKRLTYFYFVAGLHYSKYMASGLMSISPELATYLGKIGRLDPARIGLWSSGAADDKFNPALVTAVASPFPPDSFIVFYHGAMGFNRGLLEAVEAIALTRQTHPHIRYLMVGKGHAFEAIKERIESLQLQEHVHLLPAVPYEDVPRYVALADVGLMAYPKVPFWNTSRPMKLWEYMAMAKPVLIRDIPTFRDLVGETDCAFYLQENDPQAIAEQLLAIAEMDRRELAAKGEVASRYVLENFTWRREAERLEHILIEQMA